MNTTKFLLLDELQGFRKLDNIIQLSGDYLYWDTQEDDGSVAGARNVAVTAPDTRDIALKTIADYTLNANWANPSGQIARHSSSSTATLQLDGVLAAGKTFEAKVTIANRTAGSVTITNGGAAFSANTQTTRNITSTGADFIITPTSDFDGDIDLNLVELQQTDIAASSNFPGSQLATNPGLPFIFVGDNPVGWTVGGEVGTDPEVSEVGLGQSHGGVGTGSINFFSSATAFQPRITESILTIGKRYVANVIASVINNTLRVRDTSDDFRLDLQVAGSYEFEGVAGATNFQTLGRGNLPNNQTIEFVGIREANPLNGDHTGIDRSTGNRQVPVMVEYGGAGDYTDVSSAEFNSMLDPTAFALSILVQKSTWDAAERYFFSHTVDSDNWIRCGESGTTGQLLWEVRAGGTTEQILLASGSPTDLFQMGIQVKSGVMSAIYRGAIIGTEAVAGTFAGNFATMIIGAKNDTPNNVMLGKLAYHVHSTDKTASQWLREAHAAGAV